MRKNGPIAAKTPPESEGSKRPRARRLSQEERAAQLRRTAIRILAEQGIGHSNHSQIAAAAGVSLPAVFFYFPTHGDLTRAVLAEVSSFLLDGIARTALAGVEDPLDAIEAVLVTFAHALEVERDLIRIWLDWSTAVRDEAWPLYLAFRSEACAIIEEPVKAGQARGSIRADLAAAEVAEVIVGLAHMIAQMSLTGASEARIASTIHALLFAYLRPA